MIVLLSLTNPRPGFSLAPTSEFLGNSNAQTLATFIFIAKALHVSLPDIETAMDDLGISMLQRKHLVLALDYMVASRVLPVEEIEKLRGQPLERAVKMLLTLAWKIEYLNPWRIRCLDVSPPRMRAWDEIPLQKYLDSWQEPDTATAKLVEDTFQITLLSPENFFKHPLLQAVPNEVQQRMHAFAAHQSVSELSDLADVSQIYLNPFLHRDVADILDTFRDVTGMIRMVKRLAEIFRIPSGGHGYVHEIDAMEKSFHQQGYRVVECSARIRKQPYEFDLLAVRDGKMFIGEAKIMDLQDLYSRIPQRAMLSRSMGSKAKVIRDLMQQGLLAPLLEKYGVKEFGGLRFSVRVSDDPKDRDILRARVERLSKALLLPIQIDFVSGPSLLMPDVNKLSRNPHPDCAPYVLSPADFWKLIETYQCLFAREKYRILRDEIFSPDALYVGIESTRVIYSRLHGMKNELRDLVRKHGVGRVMAEIELFSQGGRLGPPPNPRQQKFNLLTQEAMVLLQELQARVNAMGAPIMSKGSLQNLNSVINQLEKLPRRYPWYLPMNEHLLVSALQSVHYRREALLKYSQRNTVEYVHVLESAYARMEEALELWREENRLRETKPTVDDLPYIDAAL